MHVCLRGSLSQETLGSESRGHVFMPHWHIADAHFLNEYLDLSWVLEKLLALHGFLEGSLIYF